ncbi:MULTISPECIES: type VI secretion system-associated FHA domain protein TagH [unclassified Variovorax]|uniref:type VI secretion system-associated FHA domain protein TagH n=1 Tax=unclassified Variovorax TaxID=663243 RepID=UPI000D126E90|nr:MULTISPECIES: type VI secretion system-associated FHA domain protein TagH [unclassified Variovorax]AVQ82330.1 type VI secretion system-associated FHA domain protein TagH [Variovorax sp. PMC12]QRY33405.1 type VI secretion system-associated FHA domain protein TagH [Variovorax sp. PDNC026]
MIHIAVITRQGAPAGQAIAADFGPNGGTIGRADTNTLVLDDPDRTVSRVHAQVLCRNGQYFVIDRGSNPMQCNGVSLGSGKEAALTDGARLVVGSFELTVRVAAAAAPPSLAIPNTVLGGSAAVPAAPTSDDPFADLLAGLAPPAAPAAPAPAAALPESLLFPDPMESGSRNAQAAQIDPFANLLGPTPSSAPVAGLGALDDFSDLGAPPAHGKATGIDELFGGMHGGGGGIGGDPLALSPLADPLLQPNTASDADPLAALQRAAPATPAARADHLPIDQFGFTPPKAIDSPAPAQPVANFDDMTGQPIRISGPESSGKPFEPPAPPVAPRRAASDDELLAAFLRGLASTHQPPEMLTPGLMERIGSMLRSATEGTLQLLLTRQEFKREVRAEVTMIAAQANNPLKFSPTVEVALAHLLGPGVRGFMPPEAAMRDAFDDLRAHQFGVMVGMRAALAHVIARFEPAELEKKISARTALDALFSANRKARLWDQFVSLYGGIASEAEDDFHSLFGKAFLQAYEEQMARLKSDA